MNRKKVERWGLSRNCYRYGGFAIVHKKKINYIVNLLLHILSHLSRVGSPLALLVVRGILLVLMPFCAAYSWWFFPIYSLCGSSNPAVSCYIPANMKLFTCNQAMDKSTTCSVTLQCHGLPYYHQIENSQTINCAYLYIHILLPNS